MKNKALSTSLNPAADIWWNAIGICGGIAIPLGFMTGFVFLVFVVVVFASILSLALFFILFEFLRMLRLPKPALLSCALGGITIIVFLNAWGLLIVFFGQEDVQASWRGLFGVLLPLAGVPLLAALVGAIRHAGQITAYCADTTNACAIKEQAKSSGG